MWCRHESLSLQTHKRASTGWSNCIEEPGRQGVQTAPQPRGQRRPMPHMAPPGADTQQAGRALLTKEARGHVEELSLRTPIGACLGIGPCKGPALPLQSRARLGTRIEAPERQTGAPSGTDQTRCPAAPPKNETLERGSELLAVGVGSGRLSAHYRNGPGWDETRTGGKTSQRTRFSLQLLPRMDKPQTRKKDSRAKQGSRHSFTFPKSWAGSFQLPKPCAPTSQTKTRGTGGKQPRLTHLCNH